MRSAQVKITMNKKVLIGGKTYDIAGDDHYLNNAGNSFEPNLIRLYSILVSKDDIVADIGANIGLTSIWFSGKVKKIYAFEPSPTTFEILKANLNAAHATNVGACNIGMGSKDVFTNIAFAKEDKSGAFVIGANKIAQDFITEKIKLTSLDNFFKNTDEKPNFLKIDVEGYETEVIKGAADLLRSCKPTAVMEMNAFCLNVLHRICLPDFIDTMKSAFPVLYAMDADNLSLLDLHVKDEAYIAMHHHIIKGRYPNLIGGFTNSLSEKLFDFVSKNNGLELVGLCSKNILIWQINGWSKREENHIWSEGNLSSMNFKISKNKKDLRKIILKGFSCGPQHLNLSLNERSVYKINLTGLPQKIEIEVPVGAFKTGDNKLYLALPDAKLPGNGDPRKLGFALKELSIC
jgi:FkbM family methyltransferase